MTSSRRSPPRIPAGKLSVPELCDAFVARPRLRDELERAAGRGVIVVSVPAGFGKTMLLADWVRSGPGAPTGWVSVDVDDNDGHRLWAAAAAALAELPGIPATTRWQTLAARVSERSTDAVDALTEALEDLEFPVRLILDDVHRISDPGVLRELARLVRRPPSSLHLVLASRSDPPISLPRLRLEGGLHELRADVLRFDLDDTDTLMKASGLELNAAQVGLVHARTEGWAAGLRLAVQALRRSPDPDDLLTSFSGDERSVADYLTGEVLTGLDAETHDFLRVVSVCTPLPVELAAELSGRPDAARLLDDLCRETSLLDRAGAGQYRIHELLRSYLVADLARHREPAFRDLQVTAARWWSEQGDAVHALRHAERAADRDVLAELLHRSGLALLLAGELGSLRRGLAAIGSTARQQDPWLALLAMITHLDARSLPDALADLQAARRAWPNSPEPALDALLASTELLTVGLGAIDPPASPLPAVSDDTAPEIEALLRASRGMAVINDGSEAELGLARTDLERAVELARNLDLGYLEAQSLTALASLAWIQRDPRAVKALAEQAVAVAVSHGHGKHPSPWSSYAIGMLAYRELMGGDPEAAHTRTSEALSAWGPLPPEAAYTLHAVHGAAQADLGDRGAGLAEIRAARDDFGDRIASSSFRSALALLEHRVALVHGNPTAAAEVADWLNRWVGETGETALMQAWADTSAGRYEGARELPARIEAGNLPVVLAETAVEVHLLRIEALLRDGDEAAAAAALDRALAEGAAAGAARPFALAGPLTRKLLLSHPTTNGQAAFAERLAAARTTVTPDAAPLLSERETAVLALLPTLLDAAEIGAEFTVSVNTVKSHIRSIYAKLGVSSRREAVLRARDRGLLP